MYPPTGALCIRHKESVEVCGHNILAKLASAPLRGGLGLCSTGLKFGAYDDKRLAHQRVRRPRDANGLHPTPKAKIEVVKILLIAG